MKNNEEILTLFEKYLAQISLPEEPHRLYNPIIYSMSGGGKRIRPALLLLCCDAFGGDVQGALPAAAAIEMFHNFTLLHDDIMDNAAVRRGKPSVYARWGENVAILSGDAMMIYAYKLLEQLPADRLPRVLKTFTAMALQVCEGQQYDMDFEALERVPMEDYLHMISLKTAVLLAGAAVIGAVCGGASQEDCDRIYTFATELGMAFQIRDDILDSYGTQDSLGKKIGGDITEGKKTFLTTAAMEIADEDTRRKLGGLMHNREMIADEKVARVLAIYDSLGVREQAETAVERYTARATEALAALSVSGGRREPMERLALELTKRLS